MKKFLASSLFSLLGLALQAQQMVPVWVNTLGGPEWDMANTISLTPEGDVFVAGSFHDSITIGKNTYFSNGHSDVFTAKYSNDGELIGAFTFGGKADDFAQLSGYDDLLILVSKSYGPLQIQGKAIDSLGTVNYLVGWYSADGALLHAQTLSSKGDLNVTSIETDHHGTVYLTGWYTKSLIMGTETFEGDPGENAFLVSFKKNGKEKAVQKWAKPQTGRYYASTLTQNNSLFVAGITSGPEDSIAGLSALYYNNLFVTSFGNGEKRNQEVILLKGLELEPVSIKEADGNLFIASKFKYYCLNGADTIHAKGQNDVLMISLNIESGEKKVWTVGGRANDLPLNLSVTGDQVILAGSYSDSLWVGDYTLVGQPLGSDLFLVPHDASTGEPLAALTLGGVYNDFPCAAMASDEGVFLLGQFKNALFVLGDTLKTVGSYDVFVARYENCGAKAALKIKAKAQKAARGETTYQLSAADGYNNYQWNNGLGYGQSTEATLGNSYVVEASDEYGCACYGYIDLSSNKSASLLDALNENEIEALTSEFKMYPTVTTNRVHWQAGDGFPADGATLRMTNASGQVVVTQHYDGNTEANTVQTIDLSHLSKGIYLVEITGTGYNKSEKVIVK